jgi:UDP-glucose 4-epimerase
LTLLITGSSGHLGQAIVTLLRRAGRDAIGLDMRPAETTDIVGSITDAKTVAKAMQGVTGVIHTATLHKPHVATHSRQDFVDTNVTGTLSLLDSARDAGASAFVFTSTTSAFGRALTPGPEDPAAWITEDVRDRPKNIYGATKTGAEALCDLAAHRDRLPVVILRCARFFPEPDDSADARASFSDANLKANEFLHRRLDLEDAAQAHVDALVAAPRLGFGRYILSAPTPFRPEDATALRSGPAAVIEERVPGTSAIWDRLGWALPADISRVYDSRAAQSALGWRPCYDFAAVAQQAARGAQIGSALAREIGALGYHGTSFDDLPDGAPYPTETP